MQVFYPTSYGAKADGIADDTNAVRSALLATVATNGRLHFPAGLYRITQPVILPPCKARIAVTGDGKNISTVVADGCDGLDLSFQQEGIQQPYGVTMRNLGLRAQNAAGTALAVRYGNPAASSDHWRPAISLENFLVESTQDGAFANGIDIEGAWNPTLHNVYVSGNACGGNWNAMSGQGVKLRGMCVNAHLSNVRCNFWAAGLQVHAADAPNGPNTEGIFCSNCSMVAVKRGVWLAGNPFGGTPPGTVPRISTFTWLGGMIEARVGGVHGGSAAFHLQNVWTALISGCQMISETIDQNVETTYGVIPQDCRGVVITGCDINAYTKGVMTTGQCIGIIVNGNTFTNIPTAHVEFSGGTVGSRSYGNTYINNTPVEIDRTGVNKMGFV